MRYIAATGNWKITDGHDVFYTQTYGMELFGKVGGTKTEYVCSCGKRGWRSNRALKADLSLHDSWYADGEIVENPLLALMKMQAN